MSKPHKKTALKKVLPVPTTWVVVNILPNGEIRILADMASMGPKWSTNRLKRPNHKLPSFSALPHFSEIDAKTTLSECKKHNHVEGELTAMTYDALVRRLSQLKTEKPTNVGVIVDVTLSQTASVAKRLRPDSLSTK